MFQIWLFYESRRQREKYTQAGTSAETATTPIRPVRIGRTIISSGSETGISQRIGTIPTKKTILTASMMIGMTCSTGCLGLSVLVRDLLIFGGLLSCLPCLPYMVVSLLSGRLDAMRVMDAGSMTVVSSTVSSDCGRKILPLYLKTSQQTLPVDEHVAVDDFSRILNQVGV